MGLTHRPYIGSWRLNQTKLVQHSPDCLVYFNGDTAVPGCPSCNGRIELQKYIIQVSVESGVDAGAASANISLAVPMHTAEGMGRDGQYLLRVGLEVHIYMRGYFPVQGQYEGIEIEEDVGNLDISQIMTYPYYHVFHGITTNVDVSKQGGIQSITVQCNSMMYFWQYVNISQNASVFANAPTNSKLDQNFVGHQYTGWTPYSIIYTLFQDIAGAASGVGTALSNKSNIDANSTVRDESLFSLNLEYWKRRFQTKMIRLRMHGGSGKLFTTAQAAFLGRLDGEQVRKILKHPFKTKTSASDTTKFDIYSASHSLGLTKSTFQPGTGKPITVPNLDMIQEGDSAYEEGIKEDARAEINMAELEPYAQKAGELGQVNYWESTYQSKLDVAQQVCQTTGYEFYQDVDGDFVFKPPLYNLDTSSSRVYRIEEIDVISISEHNKEPACTYIKFTGGNFQNYQVGGLEGEWGTRGQYIDYRLVAQFGWREETFESTYHNNERTMFYAAINRMDILNAPTRSAEISIPLRPEIRPGFPVYVAGIDCFYYLQNMSHSWTFGGSCTTNLNLVAKRPKFYAPGHSRKRGIDAIDLSQVYLPRKPLKVLDEDGNPRLSGFPNVVMALNPAGINPLHFITGADLKLLSNPLVVRNLIKIALLQNLLKIDPEGTEENGPYLLQTDEDATLSLDISGSETREDPSTTAGPDREQGPIKLDFQTFAAGANLVTSLKEQRASVSKSYEKVILELKSQLQDLISKRGQLEANGENTDNLDDQIINKKQQLSEIEDKIKEAEASLQKEYLNNPMIAGLMELFEKLSLSYLGNNSDYPDANSTASYLNMLSDKKAAFTNALLPGAYQYFSCSHPDKRYQGPGVLSSDETVGAVVGSPEVLLEDSRQDGFLPKPSRRGRDGMLPEAELGKISTTYGIRLLSSQKTEREVNGKKVKERVIKIVPTSRIRNLVFSHHTLDKKVAQAGYNFGEQFTGLGEGTYEVVVDAMKKSGGGSSLKDMFETQWNTFINGARKYPDFLTKKGVKFPDIVDFQGTTYKVDDVEVISKIQNTSSFASSTPPEEIKTVLRSTIVSLLYVGVGSALRDVWLDWQKELFVQTGTKKTNLVKAASATEKKFKDLGKDLFGTVFTFRTGEAAKTEGTGSNDISTPVFPVSDEKGYEVIGSYQYGRGIDIAPNASYDQLAMQDPLSFASPADVEDFIEIVMGKKKPDVTSENKGDLLTPVQRATLILEEKLIKSILNNPGTPSEVITLVEGFQQQRQKSPTSSGFANWITSTQDTNFKLPVTNAAYQLADLQVHVNKSVCNCRAAEADILFENAFNADNFAQIVHTEDLDQVTGALNEVAIQKSIPWSRNQKAIRGEVSDQKITSSSDSKDRALDLGQAFADLNTLSDRFSDRFRGR